MIKYQRNVKHYQCSHSGVDSSSQLPPKFPKQMQELRADQIRGVQGEGLGLISTSVQEADKGPLVWVLSEASSLPGIHYWVECTALNPNVYQDSLSYPFPWSPEVP